MAKASTQAVAKLADLLSKRERLAKKVRDRLGTKLAQLLPKDKKICLFYEDGRTIVGLRQTAGTEIDSFTFDSIQTIIDDLNRTCKGSIAPYFCIARLPEEGYTFDRDEVSASFARALAVRSADLPVTDAAPAAVEAVVTKED